MVERSSDTGVRFLPGLNEKELAIPRTLSGAR